jgi:glucose/arabinose dehydrogenase
MNMRHRWSSVVTVSCGLLWLSMAGAASLPPGFSETRVAAGLAGPTAMAVAPDGRIFVAEKGGNLRVVKNNVLLAQSFLSLSVNSVGERGLLGIAFDPDFPNNGYVYVYYTTANAPIHNRVSRFTSNPTNADVAAAGSELPLLDLPELNASNHNGGAIHFGNDGKLYIGVGENAVPSNSQSLTTRFGKLLRINSDGSIPADNPANAASTGVNRAIWARGFRNPYTFGVDPVSGRIHVNDVGQSAWEEVDLLVRNSNYGWPQVEGPDPAGVAGIRYPLHSYSHDGSTCAIVGATFYRPYVFRFPVDFDGRYFFGDLCAGFIRYLNPPNYTTATDFATGINQIVDIQTHPDGSLYYLAQGGGELWRVQSTTSTVVFSDDFEVARGWTLTGGQNTATSGVWERGAPQPTSNAGLPLQLGSCQGSKNCFITGLTSGGTADANDVDNGLTSIQSPAIALPAGREITLSIGFFVGFNDLATSLDQFRVRVVQVNGQVKNVLLRSGKGTNIGAKWTNSLVDLSACAGQTIQLRIEAVDSTSGGAASLVEAGVDNVSITAD